MNKFFTLLVLLAAAAIGLGSCASTPDIKSVAEKILRHKELNQADYGVMIDDLDEYMSALNELSEKYADDPATLEEKADILAEEHPYTEEFFSILNEVQFSLDKQNSEKYDKMQLEVMKMLGVGPDE